MDKVIVVISLGEKYYRARTVQHFVNFSSIDTTDCTTLLQQL